MPAPRKPDSSVTGTRGSSDPSVGAVSASSVVAAVTTFCLLFSHERTGSAAACQAWVRGNAACAMRRMLLHRMASEEECVIGLLKMQQLQGSAN